MTPAEVTAWRNHLPMADLGNTAKKVYHAIHDCNRVNLELKARFEILETLRTPTQFISQSLRKHYINQTTSLTKQQLTIAQLAQTLQVEMAGGYKLIVEQLATQGSTDLRNTLLPVALQRIIHYFTHIILRSYQLYSLAPSNIWKELHLVYDYAEKNQLLKQNNLGEDCKRILLLAAAYPYQWRQSEQEAIYKAAETWAPLITLRKDLPNASAPGLLIIDSAQDKPPLAPIRGVLQFSPTCKVLDVNPILGRLKSLLLEIEPNELQARIAHNHEPEYGISSSVLRGLIKEWGTPVSRAHERVPCSEPVKICIGLLATHYYINGQRLFNFDFIRCKSKSFITASRVKQFGQY